ncbi:MAG TPA: hypothetical protein PL072_00480 [Phycisphaerales bacterium]|nr:hypothetical protein [Phycisphaerales bacterium]
MVISGAMALPVPTTVNDFFEPGTQPGGLVADLVDPDTCANCHAYYDELAAPHDNWRKTMMAQAGRDPIFHAAVSIAEQDAAAAGDTCWRCHSPTGWLRGHVSAPNPTSGEGLMYDDFSGVSCSVCHRMVDPVYVEGVSPSADQAILAAISPPALAEPHSGSYVIDPSDVRRGPFNLDEDWAGTIFGQWPGFHQYAQSAFHTSSRLCATCHDVSLPHYTRQPDGSYALNALNTPGPSKHQQFPEQRTYSEWANSLFAVAPVDLGGRFGGAGDGSYSTCQDCHMPTIEGMGCGLADPPIRPNVPRHTFRGANTWVLRAVQSLYESDSGMGEEEAMIASGENAKMLQDASDLELYRVGGSLVARVINYTGHKLPTGYGEGRRMWVNVKFFGAGDQLIAERGAYDNTEAILVNGGADTKVYEARHGIDEAVAALTGLTAGPQFHLALVNKKYKDNRIPPMGFTLAAFDAVGAAPVPSDTYADGQYWDDTAYPIPAGAVRAEVRVYHQVTTREYIEFLRDTDATPRLSNLPPVPEIYDPMVTDTSGKLAYKLWEAFGKSAPTEMDAGDIALGCLADFDQNGTIEVADLFGFLDAWFAAFGMSGGTFPADADGDSSVSVSDLFQYLDAWFAGFGGPCP